MTSLSALASVDDEWDRDGAGDPPPPGEDLATASGPNDDERDHTGAGGGERTTGAGGVNIITEAMGRAAA